MNDKAKIWYLENFNFFKPLAQQEMMQLDDMSKMKDVQSKEILYFPDEQSSQIYLLKEGKIKISRSDESGQQLTLAILGPGEIFGEMSMLGEANRKEFAEVLEPSRICVIKKQDFEDLLKANSSLMLKIFQRVGFRRRQIEELVESLVFKSAPQRVASFIDKFQEEYGKDKYWGREIKPFISHQELGYITACSRQTVTTILNQMKQADIIEIKRKTLIIRDLPKLKALIEEP